jgi:hypothetical protein
MRSFQRFYRYLRPASHAQLCHALSSTPAQYQHARVSKSNNQHPEHGILVIIVNQTTRVRRTNAVRAKSNEPREIFARENFRPPMTNANSSATRNWVRHRCRKKSNRNRRFKRRSRGDSAAHQPPPIDGVMISPPIWAFQFITPYPYHNARKPSTQPTWPAERSEFQKAGKKPELAADALVNSSQERL